MDEKLIRHRRNEALGGLMRYQLLGELRVVGSDGDAIPELPRKIRILLTLLLIGSNRSISRTQLIDQVWDGDPPRRAGAALHVYVSQLRKHLGDEGGAPLHTSKSGYRMTTRAGEFDLDVFRGLMLESRALVDGRRYEEAAAELGSALRLWRGPALADLQDNAAISGFTAWIDELRAECAAMYVESQCALGAAAKTVGLLRDLSRQYPLQEIYYRELMRVLHRSGRHAEALHTYLTARRVFATRLGVEPGPVLHEIYCRILAEDRRSLAAG
ncbi:AfsR/SARP family transcriptional regulator [Nocardia asteroides]|uniref:AfsR/SARP family transcriptional regulator n=1 Tax=Nocardia asteroides TaxID=1824 RepID=UPI001E2EE883|nr:AfsR/SARP family transcriptional regulator [Nocardia asteroides]UGT55281.1 AfsR/SARP family transcriptional regulator [Nocardia asteroides]